MPTKIYSVELHGLDGHKVEIEADTRAGLPAFIVVGLPDPAVQEARQRVESSIKNSDFFFPRGKIVINLAPADLRKIGPRYDLPIAMGIIAHMGKIPQEYLNNTVIIGELALDGSVRGTSGILASTEFAKRRGFKKIIVPKQNAAEAALISGIQIIPVNCLKEALAHVIGIASALKVKPAKPVKEAQNIVDLSLIKGQDKPKRALQIAAAGGHNLLMSGAPGAGKTMLARALSGILPSMTMEEKLEVTKVYSVAGLLPKNESLIFKRPYRAIHHTASAVSIVGGGTALRPGEITLAHRGILFLDEIAEFPRSVLEVLRQPMEDHKVTIARASGTVTYPAKFTLLAAMNPCPCGFYQVQNTKRICSCKQYQIKAYHKRLSGPLLDRIDMRVDVNPVDIKHLAIVRNEESSAAVKKRVEEAAKIQHERYKNVPINQNSELEGRLLTKLCRLTREARQLLNTAASKMDLSARAYFRTIKLARTIADLKQLEYIESDQIAEALSYSPKNKT